jgi:hypothetical protein
MSINDWFITISLESCDKLIDEQEHVPAAVGNEDSKFRLVLPICSGMVTVWELMMPLL